MDVDLKQLQEDVERLHVMVFGLSANYKTLQQMVLGVFRDTLTPEEYKNVYTKYVDTLESESNEALDALDGIVSGFLLIKERFDVHEAMSHLKRDPDYILTDASKQ